MRVLGQSYCGREGVPGIVASHPRRRAGRDLRCGNATVGKFRPIVLSGDFGISEGWRLRDVDFWRWLRGRTGDSLAKGALRSSDRHRADGWTYGQFARTLRRRSFVSIGPAIDHVSTATVSEPEIGSPGRRSRNTRRIAMTTRALQRRGAVTLWTIVCMPLLATIFWGVLEVGYLYQARVEAENATDAAVLAAVQAWGDRGGQARNIRAAEKAGKDFARANAIHGRPVDLDDSMIASSAAWSFGRAKPGKSGFDFTANPDATDQLAVVLEATVRVRGFWMSVLGPSDSTVSVASAAVFEPSETGPRVKLIRLEKILKPNRES